MLVPLVVFLSGCTSFPEYVRNGFKVGPNYAPAATTVAPQWIDSADKRVRSDPDDMSKWWKNLNDPVLDQLICAAYQQNLTLREAGFRILEARAQLGIAVGSFFPQAQFASANYVTTAQSGKTVRPSISQRTFGTWNMGFNLAWEADFWGRFRRAIESADANLDSSIYDYDDVLVTLISDVATNYVGMRTLEKRIEYARENVELQKRGLKVIESRKIVGVARQLDIDQAKGVLYQTEAVIPELEIGLRQTTNRLCTLLGMPPEDLQAKLKPAPIPTVAPEVVLGIPADLLRRRPDIRRAERHAASQSALIGVAEADFYPRISLVGTIGYSAHQFKDLFNPLAFAGNGGPSVQWNILNYGRILNNVRLQDARFQELTTNYQNKVLQAQQEVESGLITFLKAQERVRLQKQSVDSTQSAVKSLWVQFETGTVGIAQAILLAQNKVQQEDTLAVAQGEIALGLIQVYKALGGGWQIRCIGCDPIPAPPPPDTTPTRLPPAATFGQPQ